MPTTHQLLTEVPSHTFGKGASDTPAQRLSFASSPLYDGTLGDAQVRNSFQNPPELVDGIMSDGGYAFGSVERYYQSSPDLSTVEVGGGGRPGSPYAPNIASPGEGNGDNAAAIPATGVAATQAQRGAGGAWPGNGLESPSVSSRRLFPRTLGESLTLGRSTRI